MRGFFPGFIVGAVTLYVSMCFHIVVANDGYHFVPKTALTFKDTYVDIRQFPVVEWRNHVPLAEAMMKSRLPPRAASDGAAVPKEASGHGSLLVLALSAAGVYSPSPMREDDACIDPEAAIAAAKQNVPDRAGQSITSSARANQSWSGSPATLVVLAAKAAIHGN